MKRLFEIFGLVAHPAWPPKSVRGVEVEVLMTDPEDVLLRFTVLGTGLSLPRGTSPERADALWETTCFELFLRSAEPEAYFEFNFSPSTQWAAYAFDSYRVGRRDLPLAMEPHVDCQPGHVTKENPHYVLEVDVDLSALPAQALRMGLCAVIEERDGTKSYWALTHPTDTPDFHHPGSFAVDLPRALPSPRA
jgi:hypothetical protein